MSVDLAELKILIKTEGVEAAEKAISDLTKAGNDLQIATTLIESSTTKTATAQKKQASATDNTTNSVKAMSASFKEVSAIIKDVQASSELVGKKEVGESLRSQLEAVSSSGKTAMSSAQRMGSELLNQLKRIQTESAKVAKDTADEQVQNARKLASELAAILQSSSEIGKKRGIGESLSTQLDLVRKATAQTTEAMKDLGKEVQKQLSSVNELASAELAAWQENAKRSANLKKVEKARAQKEELAESKKAEAALAEVIKAEEAAILQAEREATALRIALSRNHSARSMREQAETHGVSLEMTKLANRLRFMEEENAARKQAQLERQAAAEQLKIAAEEKAKRRALERQEEATQRSVAKAGKQDQAFGDTLASQSERAAIQAEQELTRKRRVMAEAWTREWAQFSAARLEIDRQEAAIRESLTRMSVKTLRAEKQDEVAAKKREVTALLAEDRAYNEALKREQTTRHADWARQQELVRLQVAEKAKADQIALKSAMEAQERELREVKRAAQEKIKFNRDWHEAIQMDNVRYNQQAEAKSAKEAAEADRQLRNKLEAAKQASKAAQDAMNASIRGQTLEMFGPAAAENVRRLHEHVRGLNGALTMNVGTMREILVLFHEWASGNEGRMGPSLIVLLERMGNLHSIVGFLFSRFGALLGVLAVVGKAMYDNDAATERFNLSLNKTANFSGQTRDSLANLKREIELIGHTTAGQANEINTTLMASGIVYKNNFEQAATLVAQYMRTMEVNAEEATKVVLGMFKSPATAAKDLVGTNTEITASVAEMIRQLELAGKSEEAQGLLIQKLNRAHEGMKTPITGLASWWKILEMAASSAWDRIKKDVSPASLEEKLESLRKRLQFTKDAFDNPIANFLFPEASVENVKAMNGALDEVARKLDLVRRVNEEASATEAARAKESAKFLEQEKAKQKVRDILQSTPTGSLEVLAARQRQLREALATGGYSAEDQAKAREALEDLANQAIQVDRRRTQTFYDLANTEANLEIQLAKAMAQSKEEIDRELYRARTISRNEQIDLDHDAALRSLMVERQAQEAREDLAIKYNRMDVAREAQVAQQILDIRAATVSSLNTLRHNTQDFEEQKITARVNDALDVQYEKLRRKNEVIAAGLWGLKEETLLRQNLKEVEDRFAEALREINNQFKAGNLSIENYNLELAVLMDTMEKAKTVATAMSKQIMQDEQNWMVGMSSALKQFGNDSQNVAEMTKGIVTDALKTMNKDLSAWLINGPRTFQTFGRAFEGMAKKMLQDWTEMQMKMRITGPLSSALGQILGNAVASGVGGYMTKVFEPSSVTTAKGDVLGVEGTGLSSVTPYTGPQWSFAQGTQYVPFDMVAQIHRGEKIVPAVENRGSGDASIVINQPITLNATNASPETISMIRKMMPALIAENKQAVVNSVNQALAAQGRRAFA